MTDLTTAFWGMTINNYDQTDLALVQQGYPDFIRQIVYTLEEGESGTPHIQAYIKLNRQQRLSYVKKLFPRGNFKALLAEDYKLNAQRYAQKLDVTARSPAVITNNPFPDPVVELTSVIESAFKNFGDGTPWYNTNTREFLIMVLKEEHARVAEKPALAKFYVSATYRSIKKEYWRSIAQFIEHRNGATASQSVEIPMHTHTHTHGEEIISRPEGITNIHAPQVTFEEPCDEEDAGSEGEDDEGGFDSSGSETCSEDESDYSGCSQSDAQSED
jgi:hypothetical protein